MSQAYIATNSETRYTFEVCEQHQASVAKQPQSAQVHSKGGAVTLMGCEFITPLECTVNRIPLKVLLQHPFFNSV